MYIYIFLNNHGLFSHPFSIQDICVIKPNLIYLNCIFIWNSECGSPQLCYVNQSFVSKNWVENMFQYIGVISIMPIIIFCHSVTLLMRRIQHIPTTHNSAPVNRNVKILLIPQDPLSLKRWSHKGRKQDPACSFPHYHPLLSPIALSPSMNKAPLMCSEAQKLKLVDVHQTFDMSAVRGLLSLWPTAANKVSQRVCGGERRRRAARHHPPLKHSRPSTVLPGPLLLRYQERQLFIAVRRIRNDASTVYLKRPPVVREIHGPI